MNTVIIIGIVIIVIFIIFRSSKKRSSVPESSQIQTPTLESPQSQRIYQKREIKNFSINGISYRKLNPNESGDFVGYVKCERNTHDKYAVAVYNNKNKQLGYTPKENVRLSESIYAWHAGQVFAWGNVTYVEYDKSWLGVVYIPLGLTEMQLQNLKETFDLLEKIKLIQSNVSITKSDHFELFDDHLKIIDKLKNLGNDIGIDYEFSKKIIPSFSKQLEIDQDWEGLIKLGDYKVLISELSEKFATSTINRIEKAKKNLP